MKGVESLGPPVRQPVYLFDGFRLDTRRRVLYGVDGQPIALTPRVHDALSYFVERSGELLTKEQLLEELWPNLVVEEHNLNKTVSELRRVLGEKPGEHKFIVTQPGRGYRFVAAVSVVPGTDVVEATPAGAEEARASSTEPASAHRRAAPWYWVAAAGGAAALTVAMAMLAPFGDSSNAPLQAVPWSVQKGQQWFPVWSPDGQATAFTTFGNPSEQSALHVRDLAEPVARVVTRRQNRLPAITQWTTTGKLLFFEREGVWSVSPVGGPPEVLRPLDYDQLGIANPRGTAHVARDGSALAVLARGDRTSLGVWIAKPPTAPLERYEPAPFESEAFYNVPHLRFSPDGTQLLLIAYAAGQGNEAWLLPFPPDASNPPRRVLEEVPLGGTGVSFGWLPDNRHVVLAVAGQPSLYLADTRSGRFRLLGTTLRAPTTPAVSPDGRRLLLTEPKEELDIVTLDLTTGEATTLIASDRTEMLPAWASNTNALVYVSDRSGPWEIWLRQEPHPDRPLITARDFDTATLFFIAPTLSPAGDRVIFHRVEAEGDGSRLWMAAVADDSPEPEPLTNEALTETAGSWSPDGEWYAYLAYPPAGGPQALKKVRTTGRATPETLLEDVVSADGGPVPVWSPDNRWILVANPTLTLVSVDGAVTRDLGVEWMPCTFAETEPLLHCVSGGRLPNAQHALIALDFDGNLVRTIAALPAALRPVDGVGPGSRLSPTPDRLGVTYAILNVSQTIWLVEGLDSVPLP